MPTDPTVLEILRNYQVVELGDVFEQDPDTGAVRLGELGLEVSDAFLQRAATALNEMQSRGCRIIQVSLLEMACEQLKSERAFFQMHGWKVVTKSVSGRVGVWVRLRENERPFIVGVHGSAPIRQDISVFEIGQDAYDHLFLMGVQAILDTQLNDEARQGLLAVLRGVIAGLEDAFTLLALIGSRARALDVFALPQHLDENLSPIIVDFINQFPVQERYLRDQVLRLWAWHLSNVLFVHTGDPMRLASWVQRYGLGMRVQSVSQMESQATLAYGPQRGPGIAQRFTVLRNLLEAQ